MRGVHPLYVHQGGIYEVYTPVYTPGRHMERYTLYTHQGGIWERETTLRRVPSSSHPFHCWARYSLWRVYRLFSTRFTVGRALRTSLILTF